MDTAADVQVIAAGRRPENRRRVNASSRDIGDMASGTDPHEEDLASPPLRVLVRSDDPLERLAQTLAPVVARSLGAPGRLLDASEIARQCGVSRGWVYAHAAELGAFRLGGGPRPRLRFDARVVEQALQEGFQRGAGSVSRRRVSRGAKSTRTGVELLPIGPGRGVPFKHGSARS